MSRLSRGIFGRVAAGLLALAGSTAGAEEEVYFRRAVSELTITDGRLPEGPGPRFPGAGRGWRARSAMLPYAAIDGAGEVYLDSSSGGGDNPGRPGPLLALSRDDVVAFRLPGRREVVGRLFAPDAEGKGMVAIAFKVAPLRRRMTASPPSPWPGGGITSGSWPGACRARPGSGTGPASRGGPPTGRPPPAPRARPTSNGPSASSAGVGPSTRTSNSTDRWRRPRNPRRAGRPPGSRPRSGSRI